jgi:FMN-dependent NADH-azoreductase
MPSQYTKSKTTTNHEKAPKCAEFVKAMREAFGVENVKVVYVEEGEIKLGEKQESIEEYYQRRLEELLAAYAN